MSDNSIWNRLPEQVALRAYQDPRQLDGRVIYEGVTTDGTQTELFIQPAQTTDDVVTFNAVPYYTEAGLLTVSPGTLTLVKGTCLGLRTDTLAAHHLSEFNFALFRPLTGNMVVIGEYGTTDYTAGTPAIAGANPAYKLIYGTQTDCAFTVNTNGTLTHAVTGEASQTIKWLTVLDYVRAISVAPVV